MIVAVFWLVLMGLAVLGCLVADKWEWIDQILPEDGEETC